MTIKFNKNIYTKKAVQKAVGEWKRLADFNIKTTEKYFFVIINRIKAGGEEIFKDEFANYVLYCLKKNG